MRAGVPLAVSDTQMHLLTATCLGLVAVVAAAGCEIDGHTVPCGLDDSCDESSFPGPPPDVEATASSTYVAVDGTVRVVATSRSGAALRYLAEPQLAVEVLREEPGHLELEIICGTVGWHEISFVTAEDRDVVSLSCNEVSRVRAFLHGQALPSEPDVFFLPADASEPRRTVWFRMLDASGSDVTDGSFLVAAPDVPGLVVLPSQTLVLPTTPGTFDVALSSRALGRSSRRIRVVERVDALVGEKTHGGTGYGTVCFYGIEHGELVMGLDWSFTKSGFQHLAPTAANCFVYSAEEGAQPRVEVEFAGITHTFDLDAL